MYTYMGCVWIVVILQVWVNDSLVIHLFNFWGFIFYFNQSYRCTYFRVQVYKVKEKEQFPSYFLLSNSNLPSPLSARYCDIYLQLFFFFLHSTLKEYAWVIISWFFSFKHYFIDFSLWLMWMKLSFQSS